jgi:hypothetical protein
MPYQQVRRDGLDPVFFDQPAKHIRIRDRQRIVQGVTGGGASADTNQILRILNARISQIDFFA